MKNLRLLVVLAALLAGGCKKKATEPSATTETGSAAATGEGTGTAGSGTGSGTGTGTGSDPGAGTGAATGAPAVRADVAAFAAVFEPINSKLDHVARARTACEQHSALMKAANAIDKNTPPEGKEAQAWLEAVEEVQIAIEEAGAMCDDGDLPAIEGQLDIAKKALDALGK